MSSSKNINVMLDRVYVKATRGGLTEPALWINNQLKSHADHAVPTAVLSVCYRYTNRQTHSFRKLGLRNKRLQPHFCFFSRGETGFVR